MTDHPASTAFSPDSTPWIDHADAEYPDTGHEGWRGIGEMARDFGVTERALRFYEAKGLLAPLRQGGSRRYGPRECGRLAMLLKAKTLGFTLSEIHMMLNTRPEGGALDISRRQCVEQIRLLEQRKREIEAALAELRRAYSSLYTRMWSGDV